MSDDYPFAASPIASGATKRYIEIPLFSLTKRSSDESSHIEYVRSARGDDRFGRRPIEASRGRPCHGTESVGTQYLFLPRPDCNRAAAKFRRGPHERSEICGCRTG